MVIRSYSLKDLCAAIVAAVFVVALAGCAGAGQRTGAFVDDATITTKVKSAFATDKTVDAMDIRVETNQGNVRLSGFADSPAEKQRAEEIARNVSGVRSVTNAITVQSPAGAR